MRSIKLQLRFLAPLFVLLLIVGYLTVPLVDKLTLRWFLSDLDARGRAVANMLSDPIAQYLDGIAQDRLPIILDRAMRDERLFAIALCDANDTLQFDTRGFPRELGCRELRQHRASGSNMIQLADGGVHVFMTRIAGEFGAAVDLVVLHDVSFVQRRSQDTQRYLIFLIVGIGLAIALITVVVAHLSWRGWVDGVRSILRGEGLLRPFDDREPQRAEQMPHEPPPELQPLASELRSMLRELEDERRSRATPDNAWTPARLRTLLHEELRGDEVIVLSNREPYIHHKTDNGIVVKRPASGLVTAVEPVMRACSGTWIAHGSGSGDRESVDEHDRVRVPPENPAYNLRRVWMTEEEEKGYYYGFANEGLWPLCHVAHVRPVFRQSDWEQYRAINQRFADAVIAEARTEDPVILIQDYHFALVPKMICEKLHKATVITFWHIPWPNPESFGICPWRRELLRGMLGSTILGFHTRYHCKNFIETVDRFLEARIEHEHSLITRRGKQTLINSYPISIHWPTDEETASWASIADCRAEIRNKIGAPADHIIAVGVDRFDYTKGILERIHAVERMFEKHPEMLGRMSFVQIAAPTRGSLDEYMQFQQRIHQTVDRINKRYAHAPHPPIVLLAEHHEADAVTRLYRGADACVVTSLHDGMNLVSKEFIAARDDERGVLILSRFAGAARELQEALIVNPYHVEETADALYRAATMPEPEQMERMRSLRTVVREYNVYRWAGLMLVDAARIRRRERIEARVEAFSED